ncbi:hypothetical protein GBAR_LOCUS26402, partial [Geodia barretti]
KKSAIERASLVSGRAKLPPLPGLRSRWRSDVLLTGASLARHSVLGLSRASRVRRRTDGELFVPRRPEEARRMESVVGKSVIVQVRGQLLPAVIRACTEPLTTLTSDFSLVDVLLEWEGEGGEGKGRREWVKLSDSSKCQALYVESKLLWAKRIITAEQQRRAVAWPSKSFSLLCSNEQQYPEIMIVEYFCDRERVRLYVQDSLKETKELHLSEAKGTLISHPYLLAVLEEWEESHRDHALLVGGQANLTGQAVSICNTQGAWPRWINGIITSHNQQTKELTVQEERSQAVRMVNPLLVHVVLRATGGGEGGDGSLQRTNSHGLQQMSSHMSNPDLLLDSSGDSALLSPHLPSPALQETTSPIFPALSSSMSPVTAYRTPSIDLHRRSSLQTAEASRMSEPNIFRRSSLDQQKMLFSYHQEGNAYTSPLVHSPTSMILGVPRGSATMNHLTQDPSGLASPQTPLAAAERSKSLENISHSLQPMPSHPFKRRMSAQVPLASAFPSKRPRYDMVQSTIRGDLRSSPEPALPSSLHRSMSLSALSRCSQHPFGLGGRGRHSTSDNHDDELDMIKEIIDRDDSLVGHQHSLTGLPAELSVSLPVLYPSEGLQVLHAYNSAPVIAHTSSAPPTGHAPHKPNTSMADSLLPPGLMSGLNGAISDFLTDTLPSHKDGFGFSSDLFSFSAPHSASNTLHQYTQNLSSGASAHPTPSDSTQSSIDHENKPSSLTNFNPGNTRLPTPHPQSPTLSEMLQTTPDSASSSSLLRSALSAPVFPPPSSSSSTSLGDRKTEPAQVAGDPEVLCPGGTGRRRKRKEGVMVVDAGEGGGGEVVGDGGELDIAVIVNQHAGVTSSAEISPEEGSRGDSGEGSEKESGGRGKSARKVAKETKGRAKRGRGRPRLTEEEKQRRKELRELGLMKRSHRRTKEEVAQWRAERILSPAKRGRKPGSGKKNVVKAVTGKEVYVTVDLSKYEPGTVLLQNGFCRAFPGMPRCMECGTCEGDLPSNRYCRFLEFRK